MQIKARRMWLVNLLACLAVVLSLLPYGKQILSVEPGEAKKPAAGQAKATAADAKGDDLFTVPDGTPDELLQYIEKLKNTPPQVTDYASFVQFRDRLVHAILGAAEKVLAANPNDQQKAEAVQSKLTALAILSRTGDAEATAKLARLPEELKKAGLTELARDADAISLQALLKADAGMSDADYAKTVDRIKTFLSQGPIGGREASLAMTAAQLAEMTGNNDLAIGAYRDLGKLLAKSDDEAVATTGVRMEGSARRMNLLGKPMLLKGVTLDGKAFDWSRYKGKVVLIDFWATWCGPCVAELPLVRQAYDLYHDRGFDVVAISLDDDRHQLEEFIQENKLPWTVLFDADAGKDSMADYYGVFGVPTVILVGADGKVISLDARGPVLESQLEELLGPIEPKQDTAGSDKLPDKDSNLGPSG